ncbi:hypothetical protein VTN77DRAFT_8469 [Rasamsonia byssochlamydoides]|uniref:uncharacterized protein n=1 Tax=Rasamsonia byssochlamydoides TaxID=89139 RepID=UPI00374432CA
MASQAVKKAVTLLGAGSQGRRLAYMWSRLGRPVHLIDQNEKQLSRAWDEIQALRLNNVEIARKVDRWGSIITSSPQKGLEHAVSNSWLLVECVPESLELKREVIKQMDEAAAPDTIIASNSSSYTILEILKNLDVKHRDRFVSLHSYWPPETPAIEIMGSDETNPEIISRLMEETRKHGFQPFHVRRMSTGFIYNRIWAAIKREALLVLDEGVATPEEVDTIFKSVLKTPKGPFEQMDVVGLDVVLDIEKHYSETRPGMIPEGPRRLLQKMVDEGRLGVKTGSGFFEYGSDSQQK